MNKELIKKYIHHLQIKHIKDYAKSQNIFLSEEEATILYQFIQNHYEQLLEDSTTIFQLKDLIREDLYQQVVSLYHEKRRIFLH